MMHPSPSNLLTGILDRSLMLNACRFQFRFIRVPLKPSFSLNHLAVFGLLLLAIALSACQPASKLPSIAGNWDTGEPTNFLFEFKTDSSVMLHSDKGTFPAWHYKVLTEDTLRLVDGMGRPKEYRYVLSEDKNTLDLYVPGQDTQPAYHFTRVP